jgi:hypothetical protein
MHALQVYYSNGHRSLTIMLPSGVTAFSFTAEPNPWNVFHVTATGTDGTSQVAFSQDVDGNSGARMFGFVAVNSYLSSITVSSTDTDFGIAELSLSYATPYLCNSL